VIAVIHGWPSRRTQRLRRAVGPGIGRHNDCEQRAHLCGGGAKEWAHRRDHRRLVYYGRLDLCAHDPRGENSNAPPSRRRYQAACSQQRPHDIHERRGCWDHEESRFTTPLPPAETVGRSPDVPFEEAADARIQCVPQTVPVLIRSNNAGLSCTNTSHNRDYKTFRQFKRAILKFLKHTIPKNWNRLCDRITDNFPRHPR
jgi:hypothetical protein